VIIVIYLNPQASINSKASGKSDVFALLIVAAIALNATTLTAAAETPQFGIGLTATKAEIEGWDIDVRADGHGLPEGRGSVRDGQQVYAETCAACHGDKGEGKLADRLVGGFGITSADFG
jgi:mono/diheme cytochrome c family protein